MTLTTTKTRLATTYTTQLVVALALLVGPTRLVAEETFQLTNTQPQIQQFAYPVGSSNGPGGVRDRASTFGDFSGFNSETSEVEFYPGTGASPARRGSFIIASNTSLDIPVGLDASRYQINSLKITTTLIGSQVHDPSGYSLPYDNTIDNSLELTTAGGDDPGQPIELYGIGLQRDYTTLGFDRSNPQPNTFELGDQRWRTYHSDELGYNPTEPEAWVPYQYFALDANGDDAENAVTGGYSATSLKNTTGQFTPDSFAIGKVYHDTNDEYAPGTLLANGDVFVFEPDLNNPGILSYIQNSLAEGHLGFTISSLHQPAGHTGSIPYADFYLDDLDFPNQPNTDGDAPTIEIQVAILDESLSGDFDNDQDIDGADFLRWQRNYGTSNTGDLADWQANYGTANLKQSAATATTIPEPSSSLLLLAALLGLSQQSSRGHSALKTLR